MQLSIRPLLYRLIIGKDAGANRRKIINSQDLFSPGIYVGPILRLDAKWQPC